MQDEEARSIRAAVSGQREVGPAHRRDRGGSRALQDLDGRPGRRSPAQGQPRQDAARHDGDRGKHVAIRDAGSAGHAGPFVEFMLGIILRTIRERGVRQGGSAAGATQKTTQKTTQKATRKAVRKPDAKSVRGRDTAQTLLAFLKGHATASISEMAERFGLSAEGVKWNLRKLKAAGRLRRVGADRGGRWEVVR